LHSGLQARALLAEHRGVLEALGQLTRYWIEVSVDFDPPAERATLSGRARIHYTNRSSASLSELYLMLWPNDDQYFARMEVGPLLVDGRRVATQLEHGHVALRARLPEPLAPGEQADLALPFHIEAGGPIGGTRPRRFGITEGVLAAPTFYPLVPPLEQGQWQVGPAPPGGDTTYSETALFHVTVEAPAHLKLAASGVEIMNLESEEGTQRRSYLSGPMRDFAFALGPFEEQVRQVEEVQVRAWYLPEHAEGGERMLAAGSEQLAILSELVGPYPYPELDLVDLPGAFGGIEYPGLVFVGTLGGAEVVDPTVHEVGHQWFYGLVGNDQIRDPWLDEAAATYTQILYEERVHGSGRASGALAQYRTWLQGNPSAADPIGWEVGAFGSVQDYFSVVYLKGALFFDALRAEMGDEAFFQFLRSYYRDHQFGVAEPEDFESSAESACGCVLDPLFARWVYEGGEMPGP
jgi:hypothetical protein